MLINTFPGKKGMDGLRLPGGGLVFSLDFLFFKGIKSDNQGSDNTAIGLKEH